MICPDCAPRPCICRDDDAEPSVCDHCGSAACFDDCEDVCRRCGQVHVDGNPCAADDGDDLAADEREHLRASAGSLATRRSPR